MLEKRRVEIENGLAEAKRMTEEGKKFDSERATMLEEAKKEAKTVLDNAISSSQKIKDQMQKEADAKAKEIVEFASKRAEEEKKKMMMEVKEEIRGMAKEMAESILRENVDPAQEKKFIEKTIQ